jgi:hypothetical protein
MPFIDIAIPGVILPPNVRVHGPAGVNQGSYINLFKTSVYQQSLPSQAPGEQAGGRFVSAASMINVPCTGVGLVAQQSTTDQQRVVNDTIRWVKTNPNPVAGARQYDLPGLLKRITGDIREFIGKVEQTISLPDYCQLLEDPVATEMRHIMVNASSGVQQSTLDGIDFDTIGADVVMFDNEEQKMDVALETDLPSWEYLTPLSNATTWDPHEQIRSSDQVMFPCIELDTTSIESSEAFADTTCVLTSRVPHAIAYQAIIKAANELSIASIFFVDTVNRALVLGRFIQGTFAGILPVFMFVNGAEEYFTPETRVRLHARDPGKLLETLKRKGVVICLRHAGVLAEFYKEMAAIKTHTPGTSTLNPKPHVCSDRASDVCGDFYFCRSAARCKTLNPRPYTLNPKSQTLNPKP